MAESSMHREFSLAKKWMTHDLQSQLPKVPHLVFYVVTKEKNNTKSRNENVSYESGQCISKVLSGLISKRTKDTSLASRHKFTLTKVKSPIKRDLQSTLPENSYLNLSTKKECEAKNKQILYERKVQRHIETSSTKHYVSMLKVQAKTVDKQSEAKKDSGVSIQIYEMLRKKYGSRIMRDQEDAMQKGKINIYLYNAKNSQFKIFYPTPLM
eukprot:TRINITY_DN1023_c0_g4_i1.p1 TRINITY_DN1023_c0_g4~~TRINITY_DN1023_c0_g4_i1.p1  ORF type:complete len:211 (-),score=17.10 TRINITY_DN1023_c0_g4_i1:127-759(-)